MGAFGAFGIALLSRKLNVKAFIDSLSDTVRGTSQIFAIALGAVLFTKFMGISDLPGVLCKYLQNFNLDPVLFMAGISLVYIFLGMFLDSIGIMLLTLPVVFPVIEGLHLHPVWFGIIMIKYLEIGLITPPVGLNVYVIKGVVGDTVPLEVIFRGIWWFLMMEVLTLALLVVFPGITLFLPKAMTGR